MRVSVYHRNHTAILSWERDSLSRRAGSLFLAINDLSPLGTAFAWIEGSGLGIIVDRI